MLDVSAYSVPDIPACAPTPPAADIHGALAKTEYALGALTDSERLERIGVVCLAEYVPALRNTGGSGDQQRDGVGGSLSAESDPVVLTASLDQRWAKKIERDLEGLARHRHKPELVVAVTNRKTGAKRRNVLEKDARTNRGYKLRVIDVKFLALRLLSPELLAVREELLGLPVPQLPVAVDAAEFSRRQPDLGAPAALIGRTDQLEALAVLLQDHACVEITGPGGIGKTRLILEAHSRTGSARTLFLDDRARLDSNLLGSELAGADELTLVVDNAHRREDLSQVVGLLAARTGKTRLILIARPGYEERLRQATEGTGFGGPRPRGTLKLDRLGNKEIGELVRAAQPEIEFEGAVERIVDLAAGNPLIALLAHRVASSRRGLHGLAFSDLLSEYARSAVAAAVGRRGDVQADDLHDVLAVVAALGPVGPSDEGLLSSLLGLPVRAVRHRMDDLADAGLLAASGEQLAITPDLLSAHLLHLSHFMGRATGVHYREIWNAANDDRRDVMCSALGGLQGFDVSGGMELSVLVGDALVALAATQPSRALTRAQSVAPGLLDIAVRTVDSAITTLPEDPAAREKALLVAMDVLSRVTDVSAGWPRQLTVAQAYFAAPRNEAATTKVHDALTNVYKRLPVNTSAYDGHVLAYVQDVLAEATVAHWEQHRGEPGCARTIATAAGQLLTVVSERSYVSAEDDMAIKLSAGFLPAGDRTALVLGAGSRLIRESLGSLELDIQQVAIRPISELERTARGLSGPFGAMPTTDLVTLAGQTIEQLIKDFAALHDLPLPTRSALIDALGHEPWPDDDELRGFRDLLRFSSARERRDDHGARADQQAAALLAAADLVDEIDRWQRWLRLAQDAGMRHAAHMIVGPALAAATRAEPERLAAALESVLTAGGPLADHAAAALAELVQRPDGDRLMRRLMTDAPPSTRAAVAGGLVGASDEWADVLLGELAEDEERPVRWAVARAAGWTQGGSMRRVRLGLRACLPKDIGAALTVLSGTKHRVPTGLVLPLDEDAASTVVQLAANAAREPHIEAYELAELAELAELPRLVLDACIGRARWLAHQPANNFDQWMAREDLPDELADAVRAGAEDRDRDELMELLEDPSVDRNACGDAVTLLAWIDDHARVTDRLGDWLASGDERLGHFASELLRLTRDPDRYIKRARALLAREPPLDLTDALLDAREPVWLVGSEKAVLRHLILEFGSWARDEDERVASVGRTGLERFRKRLADADGDEDDDETEWG